MAPLLPSLWLAMLIETERPPATTATMKTNPVRLGPGLGAAIQSNKEGDGFKSPLEAGNPKEENAHRAALPRRSG